MARNREIAECLRKDGVKPDLLESGFRDMGVSDWEEIQFRGFTDAVHRLRAEIKMLGPNYDEHHWLCPSRGPDGTITAAEISDLLSFIAVCSPRIEAPKASRRQPWHAAGRSIARLVEKTLRECGHDKKLRMTDAESLTAAVGASAINWAYAGVELQAAGFAAAMKNRDRSKAAEREMFPDAGRLRKSEKAKPT